jgi:hypothetical protein
MYDIRLKEEDSPYCGLSWPYELDDVTKYLRVCVHTKKKKKKKKKSITKQ